jgi:prepilin-type N-terminal cleavage/methylation domain-containing protein
MRKNGFSLIELLVVVGIILIVAAIAIPNFMKSRAAANESSAVASLHSLLTAEINFATACPETGFTATLTDLGSGTTCPGGNKQIDSQLETGTKSGYTFAATVSGGTPKTAFSITADPISTSSGTRHFYLDQSGSVRYNPSSPATSADSPL